MGAGHRHCDAGGGADRARRRAPAAGGDAQFGVALSYVEQGYDKAADGTPNIAAELERLNDAYEKRFGFRYCVFVAGRSREALLPNMRAALDADRAAELRRGLLAVVDIARDRYATLTAASTDAREEGSP